MRGKKIISVLLSALIFTSFCKVDAFAENLIKDSSEIVSNIQSDYGRKISFNEDWKFNLGNVPAAKDKNFDDSAWRDLTLPHDWSIELDFNKNSQSTHEGGYLDGGTGWYRKTFVLPKTMDGKEISINFNGVYMDSYIYVNGKQVGNHPYGYTPFSFNITDELIADGVTENVISVKVTNEQPSSRWYSGSGIYRDVNLTVTEKIHVAEYGTYVTTPDLKNEYKNGNAKVNIQTDVVNNENEEKEVVVKSKVISNDGSIVAENISTDKIESSTTKKFNADVNISNPILWGTENPYLYTLETTVIVNNEEVDKYYTDFGVRWFEMTADKGFFLNGEQMKLEGVSMHHDQGALGAIDNKASIRRQVKKLKEMGVNSIRVTHNPASDNLIEICNEEGILLVDEAFDGWYSAKKTYDYGRFFEKKSIYGNMTWAEFDIKQMVHRGKNAPSIIMWSLGNEVWVTQEAKGQEMTRKLRDWVNEIDDTRPTTYGESLFQLGENGEGGHEIACDEVDTVGFNYGDNHYDFFHEKYPDWVIYGSETSSALRSRGEYAHPEQKNVMDNHADLQQSSYDNDYVGWGKTAEDSWKIDRDREYVQGQYIWTGFDYIGEPTPYINKFPSKSSYFGAIDTAGFEKDAFYFYQSQWSEEPMVHLLPHWNWEDDKSIMVDGDKILLYAYTNANSVDLYFNEDLKSNELGTLIDSKGYDITNAGYNGRYKETADGKLHLEFRIPYKPGKLTAIAKDENENEIARDEIKTAKEAKKIELTPDRQVISADGYDLSFITVDILDENGTFMPTADNLLNFEVRGNGKIVGVDNGNAASVERYKDNKRKAYNGKALVIVQSTKDAGSFTLTAKGQGLSSDKVTVYTVDDDLNENRIIGYDINDVSVPVKGSLALPETIKAIYLNGSNRDVRVTWEEVSSEKLETPGIFTVKGQVNESNDEVFINVIVKDIVGVLDTRLLAAVGGSVTLPSEVS
ncbi:glycoside hydrolase family 2 TIM barrel-domain containing protein, partial [Clostridium sp.]|uniref:glycoside hydrolase family 2 TIM barrel-domain containing protein n=1 Tax=Clostridium sp. TaxID=1506 RepID=UPI003F388850